MTDKVAQPLLPETAQLLFTTALIPTSIALGAIFVGAALQVGVLVSAVLVLVEHPQSQPGLAAAFWWALLLFIGIGLKVFGFHRISRLTAQVAADLRKSLAVRVTQTDLPSMELVGSAALKTAFSADAQAVSRAASSVAMAANSIFVIGTLVLFLLTIEPLITLFVCSVFAIIQFIYRAMQKHISLMVSRMNNLEDTFLSRAGALFSASKDLRVDHRRATDFWNNGLASAMVGLRRKHQLIGQATASQIVFYDSAFDIVTMILAFIIASYVNLPGAFLLIFLTLFAFERHNALAISVNAMGYGDVALARVRRVMEQLRRVETTQPVPQTEYSQVGFRRLVMKDVSFHYPKTKPNDAAFGVGPLSLTIDSGKIYFIQGGNGAGKSTTLKLLCGFYRPTSGTFLLDDLPGSQAQIRQLFSIILTDFHLFEQLYQFRAGDEATLNLWLERLRLNGLVTFDGEQFSTTALSTGQRKRLAMIAAILQRRPILVLDEWTADQDPEFRQYFFTTLLPLLRDEGRTIIAVTHDDRYFQACDTMIKIADGNIQSIDHRLDRELMQTEAE